MRSLIILLAVVLGSVFSILPLSAYMATKGLAAPQKEWAEPAVYFAARTRMRMARFPPAVALLQRAIKTWPNSPRVDEATYWIGFCYERAEVSDQAIAWYKAFLQKYPKHEWAAQAKRRLDTLEAQNL
jgi:TolA-binding protein